MQMALRRTVSGHDEQLSAHAELRKQCVARVERQPQVLAPAPCTFDALSGQYSNEVLWTGEMSSYGARMVDLDAGYLSTRDTALETAAYDLNFGKLWHRPR
jgi:hypothetical protein